MPENPMPDARSLLSAGIPSPASSPLPGLSVSSWEEGMKLLRFLERRLPEFASQHLLHKWIRTGQVRVNGKRSGPFVVLRARDVVRVPPFVLCTAPAFETEGLSLPAFFLDPALALAVATEALLVLRKAGGLPVQPGSGHEDSVVLRLQKAFAGAPYIPSPAHRLDRHTSGLLLAGRSHTAQQALHRLFAVPGSVVREYLTWVRGAWPHEGPRVLADTLCKTVVPGQGGRESVIALAGGVIVARGELPATRPEAEGGPNAMCAVIALRSVAGTAENRLPREGATLLLVRLFTGRTHQIRVQFASRGFPVIGDGRYNGPKHTAMLLHAWRIRLPEEWTGNWPGERDFSALPAWGEPFRPETGALERASAALDAITTRGMR